MKKILFVDDVPHLLQGLKRMLRPLHHEWDMAFAGSGKAALQTLAGRDFDVVLADMQMQRLLRDNNIDLIVFDEEMPGMCGTSAGPEPPSITEGVPRVGLTRRYLPPLIETFHPGPRLPPDVIAEWDGERILPSEIDRKDRHTLQSVQSQPRVICRLQIWRTWLRRLGLRRPKSSGVVYRVRVKDRKHYADE